MTVRLFLCLMLIALIALVAVCPLPVGHGPRSAVYGPATAFRAYQAALRLQSTVSVLVLALTSFILFRPPHTNRLESVFDPNTTSASLLPLFILRC